MPRYRKSLFRSYVDTETGEENIIESAKEWTVKLNEDQFYFSFIDYFKSWFNLKSASTIKILAWMCNNAEFNTGKTKITAGDKKDIMNICDIKSPNYIYKCIKELKAKDLITGDKGIYYINPCIFWKGDLKVRKKLMKNSEFCLNFEIKPIEEETNNNENNGDN